MIECPDVSLARYLPESFPVAEVAATIATTGTTLADFSRFSPNTLTIQNIAFAPNTDVELRVAVDRRGDSVKLYGPATKSYLNGHESVMVTAMNSLRVQAQAMGVANRSNEAVRFNVTVRPRTMIDLYRMGGESAVNAWLGALEVSEEVRQSLTASLTDLIDQDLAGGMLPVKADLLGDDILNAFRDDSRYSGVYVASRVLPAIAAGATTPICDPITVPEGHIAVLLGIAADGKSIRDLGLYRDTFIYVDRYDGNQPELCRMDMAAMPGETAGVCGEYMRMFVPTMENRMDLRMYSTTGVAAGQLVKVMYGVKKVSATNRIAWGAYGKSNIPQVNERVAAADTKYGLTAKILFGNQSGW